MRRAIYKAESVKTEILLFVYELVSKCEMPVFFFFLFLNWECDEFRKLQMICSTSLRDNGGQGQTR